MAIYNPLFDTDDKVKKDTPGLKSLSLSISDEGKCPKCQSGMRVVTASSEKVFFCPSCRVCLPLSNQTNH